jgi:hypothetical protein
MDLAGRPDARGWWAVEPLGCPSTQTRTVEVSGARTRPLSGGLAEATVVLIDRADSQRGHRALSRDVVWLSAVHHGGLARHQYSSLHTGYRTPLP